VLHKPVKQSELFDVIQEVLNPEAICPKIREQTSETFDFSGKRILLAEDNEINRQIAAEILAPTNAVLEMAEDGREAVEKALAGGYDLILMDVQMPIMDGYQATREITSRLGSKRPPVVALSAHAMKGDSDVGLAAGMDAYLTKPISRVKLLNALARWLNSDSPPLQKPQGDGGPQAATVDEPLAATSEICQEPVKPLPRLPGMDVRAALARLGVSLEGYTRMVRNFSTNLGDMATRLREAKARGEASELGALAHSIAGPASSLGFETLARTSRNLERQAGVPGADLSRALMDIDDAIGQAMEQADTFVELQQEQEAQPDHSSPEGIKPAALDLAEALKDADPVASRRALEALGKALPNSPVVVRLDDLLRTYRFEEAARIVAENFARELHQEADA